MPDLSAQPLQVELAIIGAGPAGLAAAAEASDLGMPATLIDVFPRPGGQYFKQTPAELDGQSDAHLYPLLDRLSQGDMRVISDTAVWGIFPEGEGYLLCLYGPARRPAASAGQEGHPGAGRARPASPLSGLDPAGRDHSGSRLDPG